MLLATSHLASSASLPVPERGFVSFQPAKTWEEGLLSGNGTIGANALSRPLNERIIFTHERLFMPMGAPTMPPDQSTRLFEIRKLIDRGLYQQATELQFALSGQEGFMYPDKTEMKDMQASLAKLPDDYTQLLHRHAKLHGELFNRTRLDLGGGADHQRTTEELLAESTYENPNRALIEKEFDAGRYNIICSTGKLPPNLQGVWGGTYVPGWASDYTHNGNVPSAIAANLMGNLPELTLAYTSYIEFKLDNYWQNNQLGFMSFGLVQLGQATTSLGEGELAYRCLTQLVNRYWLNNLASMHNHRSLFNMDICGGMPAVIIKMLVASETGETPLTARAPQGLADRNNRRSPVPRPDRGAPTALDARRARMHRPLGQSSNGLAGASLHHLCSHGGRHRHQSRQGQFREPTQADPSGCTGGDRKYFYKQ